MAVQVDGLFADNRKIINPFHGVGGIFLPLSVNPCPDFYELSEIDLRVKIRRKISAMTSGVNIQYVYSIDLVEISLYGKGAVGIDNSWVKTSAEYSGHSLVSTSILPFPLIICIPGWFLADLVRFLMDGGVNIGSAGLDARLQHRHIDEGCPKVYYNSSFALLYQLHCRRNIKSIELSGIKPAFRVFQMSFPGHTFDNCVAFCQRPRCDANITQDIVVHRRLVGRNVRHSASADNHYVLSHVMHPSL